MDVLFQGLVVSHDGSVEVGRARRRPAFQRAVSFSSRRRARVDDAAPLKRAPWDPVPCDI
jgi:hypothetical protein